MEKKQMMCDKCKKELELIDAEFRYLEHSIRHKVPRCPGCGQVYLSEDFIKDRVLKVEEMLEEK